MVRTEDEIVTQASVEVILGGTRYKVAPLVIRDSREWRKEVVKLVSSLPQYAKATTDNPQEFEDALNAIMVAMPDKVIDLFFQYAKDLNRDEIEGLATDTEIARAFEQVIEVAFPLAQSLPKVMGRLSQ